MAKPTNLLDDERKLLLARNVFANGLGFCVIIVQGFVMPRFIKDFHNTDVLGLWDLAWSLVAYVALLTFGVTSSVNRHVARFRTREEWGNLNQNVNTSLVLLSLAGLLGLVAGAVFAMAVAAFGEDIPPALLADAQWCIFILCTSASIQLPGSVFGGVITGYERFDVFNVVRGTRDGLVIAVMLYLLWAGYGIVALAITKLALDVVCEVVKIVVTFRLCPTLELSFRHVRKSVATEVLSFGGKTVLQAGARAGLYQFNAQLIFVYLGTTALALFTRQRALVLMMIMLVKQYAQVFVPSSSALQADDNVDALRKLAILSVKYGLYITLPIAIGLIFLGNQLMEVWMGRGFQSASVLIILAVAHLISAPQQSLYTLLVGMGKHGIAGLLELAATACSIVLGFLFLAATDSGLTGAAIAIGLPVAIGPGLAMPWIALRQINLPVAQYIKEAIVPPVVAVLPFAFLVFAATAMFHGSAIQELAVASAVGGTVLAGVYWTWVVPAPIKRRLISRKARRSKDASVTTSRTPNS